LHQKERNRVGKGSALEPNKEERKQIIFRVFVSCHPATHSPWLYTPQEPRFPIITDTVLARFALIKTLLQPRPFDATGTVPDDLSRSRLQNRAQRLKGGDSVGLDRAYGSIWMDGLGPGNSKSNDRYILRTNFYPNFYMPHVSGADPARHDIPTKEIRPWAGQARSPCFFFFPFFLFFLFIFIFIFGFFFILL
jgi:hypothetical protein